MGGDLSASDPGGVQRFAVGVEPGLVATSALFCIEFLTVYFDVEDMNEPITIVMNMSREHTARLWEIKVRPRLDCDWGAFPFLLFPLYQ